jgi:acetolactate synthase-1/3 small subunit
MTHTVSVLVENKPGALARIAGLFARRGFNIDSLAVGESEDPSVSRMTIVVSVEEKPLDHITKQLQKLVNVLHIAELPHDAAEIFRAKVVDVDRRALTIEATGTPDKIAALEELLRPYGLVEIARTGRIALGRGGRGLSAPSLHPVATVNRTVSASL